MSKKEQFINKFSRYDLRVQLCRILACMIVIGCHTRLEPVLADGTVDKQNLFLYGFFDDGVAIFFCLMGFYLFNNKSYLKLLKRTLKSIFLPTLLVSFISVWVYHYQTYGSVQGVLSNFRTDIGYFLSAVFTGRMEFLPNCAHFWYITTYIQIIILFPVIRLVCKDNRNSRIASALIVGLTFCGLVLADIQAVVSLSIGKFTIPTKLIVPIYLVILGNLLWRNREKFEGKIALRVGSLILAVVVNVLRFFLQLHLYQEDISNIYYAYWYTGIASVFTVCVIVFFLSFGASDTNSLGKSMINFVGKQTFWIYLVHILIYTSPMGSAIKTVLFKFFLKNINFTGRIGLEISYIIIIFILSLMVAALISGIGALCSNLKRRL